MMSGGDEFVVTMEGGRPWGFTLQGGADFRSPLKIGKVTSNGKAEKAGIVPGDIIISINGLPCKSVKHHEAQKMVMTSRDKVVLTCTKASSLRSPPASASSSLSFEFSSGNLFSPTSSHSSTLSRHIRQSSLDFEPMPRRRSSSDVGKRAVVGKEIAGIKVPAPPPTSKKEEVAITPIANPSPVRQIAGITVPAPPPSVRSKSKSTGEAPFSLRSHQPNPVPASVPASVSAGVPTSAPSPILASLPASLSMSVSMPTSVTSPVPAPVPTAASAQSEHRRSMEESVSILSNYLERTMKASSQSPRLVNESVGVMELEPPPLELQWNGDAMGPSDSADAVQDKKESSAEQPLTDFEPDSSLSVVTEQCSMVEMKDSNLHIKLPVGSSSSQSNGVTSPVSAKSSLTQDDNTDRPSLTSSTNAEDEVFVHKRTSSQGSDWYRQMFNNIRKGVEGDIPNKKHVWDRTPVPARESTVNFTRTASADTPGAKPATYGQTKRTPAGNYALSAKLSEGHSPGSVYSSQRKMPESPTTSVQPLRRQTHSASTLENKPEVVRSSHPTTIYSKNNSRSFASSKNYWKSIETYASKEKAEIQQRSESLKRRRASASSNTSSGDQVAFPTSPEFTKDDNQLPTTTATTGPSAEKKSSPELGTTTTNIITNGTQSPDSQPESSGEEPSPVEDLANQIELQVAETVEWIQSPLLQSGNQFELPVPEEPTSQSNPSTEPAISVEEPVHKPAVEDEVMAKLHPLLAGDLNNEADGPSVQGEQVPTNVLERIDANKLHSALGNSVLLNQLEQQGASPMALQAAALAVGQSSKQPQQQPVKKQPPQKKVQPPPGEKARAQFDFEPTTDRELGFKKGDVIDLVRQVNQDWLEGSLEGRTGILPVSYVKVLSADELLHLGTNVPEINSLNQLAKAKFDFTGKSEKELSFKKGDILTLLREVDDNWYEASLEDQTGIIPAPYIAVFDSN